MGKLPGHRQVTIYMNPELYERVRCAAYVLGEDIYEFAGEAFAEALKSMLTPSQRSTVDQMARHNLKNGGRRQRLARPHKLSEPDSK